MSRRKAVRICAVLSALLCILFARDLPLFFAFLDASVRRAAPAAVASLQSKGIWLVNTELTEVKRQENQICFLWNHRYRSREMKWPTETLTTCL